MKYAKYFLFVGIALIGLSSNTTRTSGLSVINERVQGQTGSSEYRTERERKQPTRGCRPGKRLLSPRGKGETTGGSNGRGHGEDTGPSLGRR